MTEALPCVLAKGIVCMGLPRIAPFELHRLAMSDLPTPAETAHITDVVVVGAGPAGLFQIFQLGLQGLACHAIDALPHPGGQCMALYPHKPIYDIPAVLEIDGAQLSAQLHQQLAPFHTQWHWGHTVDALHTVQTSELPAAAREKVENQNEDKDENKDESSPAPSWLCVRTRSGLGQAGATLYARAVVLAIGPGAFTPRIPKIEGLDALLQAGEQVFVQSHDQNAPVARRRVVVYGGDEDAVRRVLQLAQSPATQRPAELYLLHRRDVFRAEAEELAQLQTLRDAGAVTVLTGQIDTLDVAPDSNDRGLRALNLIDPEGQSHTLELDTLLIYQGITPKLGKASEWALEMEAKHLVVDPATMQTSLPGVYAVGDIARYPGKRKLIASGFHEAIVCAFAIAERLQGKPPLTQYTTTSTLLLQRLGKGGVRVGR